MTPLLDARDLRVSFHLRREGDMPWAKPRELRALNGVNFTLAHGHAGIQTGQGVLEHHLDIGAVGQHIARG